MIEALEARIAPAALTVTSYHGIMNVKGTPAGTVTITELAGGKVQVQNGGGTFNPIGPISTISVQLEADVARNDFINFDLPIGVVHNVLVGASGGDDVVHFKSGGEKVTATVRGGAGSDTVEVEGGAHLHYLNFTAGQGNNTLKIVGSVATNALFDSFDGVDTVNLTSTGSVGRLYTMLHGGNDSITIDGAVTQLAQLITNNGLDAITVSALSHVHVLNIYAGTDNDTVTLAGLVDGSIYVDASDGNDVLTLSPGVKAIGNLTVAMGKGNDTTNFAGSFFNATVNAGADNDRVDLYNGIAIGNILNIALGTGNNVIASALAQSTTLNTAYRVIVSAGTGDDQVQLSGFDVRTSVAVSLGSGINSFQIPVRSSNGEIPALKAASLTYSGGVGIDTVNVESGQSVIGIGTFNLSYGNDVIHFTGSQSIFTSALRVYGSLGMDTLTGQSLFTNIMHTYSSIESLS